MSEISDDVMDELMDAFETIEEMTAAESVESSIIAINRTAVADKCHSDSRETAAAGYGNGEFVKLRDCDIDVTAVGPRISF